jgi:hypothetical protein
MIHSVNFNLFSIKSHLLQLTVKLNDDEQSLIIFYVVDIFLFCYIISSVFSVNFYIAFWEHFGKKFHNIFRPF